WHPDGMGNSAATIAIGPVVETSAETWDHVVRVNLRGVFLGCREAARQLVAQGDGGRIINASSGAGRQGNADIAAYAASKFGVIGLTQSLAVELAPYGVLERLPGFDIVPARRLREGAVDAAAVPARDALGPDPHEHARQVERRLEVRHSLRAEVAEHHPPRELDPVAVDELGVPAHHHALVRRFRVVDAERHARVASHVAAEARELLRHEPEVLAVVLVPGRIHVRPAILADR